MVGLILLLIAGGTDAEFLDERLRELAQQYERLHARQSPVAIRERGTVVRELAHLPFEEEGRVRAGRLLARIISEERSYRVRAEATRAIARVGTPDALAAMVRALFGPQGREPRFELLYAVLPDALANLRHPDDLDWIGARILGPAAGRGDDALLREAGPLAHELVTLTLAGLAHARAASLGTAIAPLARADDVEVRAAAVAALAALEIPDDAIDDALTDKDERVRVAAAGSRLRKPGQAAAAVADPSPLVRAAAIRSLARREEPEVVDLLVGRLRAEEAGPVRLDLADALHRLTGKDFGTDADLWAAWWQAVRETWDGPGAPETGERAYFFDVSLRTSRVTFVIDVSASMATVDDAGVSRLSHAARELGSAIAALPPDARFRVIAFAAEVRGWPDAGDAPGDRTRAGEAVNALLSQKPAGATNTYAALMTAIEDPFAPDTIVLLSDGSPYRCAFRGKTYSEPEQILHEVRQANARRAIRIHALALLSGRERDPGDADAASDFLRRLAAGNRGEFREIR